LKIEINATARSVQGKGASRRMRREGKVPGILYGAGKDAQTIELDHNELFHKLKLEAFHASILDMKLDGQKTQVLLRDTQWHPFRQQVAHIDFQRVAADQKIHMKVPLHFKNGEVSPGVKLAGGLVNHVMNEIDITCLPGDLPEFIEVDLSNLQAGHSIHVSEVTMPKGVALTNRLRMDDPPVATIVIPKVVTEEEEAAAAAVAPAAGEVPTTAQAAAPKEGEAAAGDKAGGKDKAAGDKGGGKDKKDKK
jgi:large subunit ribosomal protein L25